MNFSGSASCAPLLKLSWRGGCELGIRIIVLRPGPSGCQACKKQGQRNFGDFDNSSFKLHEFLDQQIWVREAPK